MGNIFKKLIKSKFVRNVFIMATGTAGAQAVTMALSPIITRLYGPEAFGIMGTFTALTQIIIPVAALTYPIAIVLPKSDKNAKGLIKLSLYITLAIAAITTVILLFFNDKIVNVFQLEEIAPFLYLMPLVIIFAGIMQVCEQWLIRTNQFSINAKASFLQSLVTNGSKAGIGLIYPTATVLVVLQAIGNGIKAFMMIMFARKTDYKNEMEPQEEEFSSIKELAKKYRDFPTYRSPQVLLGAFSESLPILLLTTFFGPASAGFYSIGRTVLGLPSRLIGQSIGDVFYPRISEGANNGEDISRLITKATLSLGAIGVIPFGAVIIFGPWLFEFVFGSGWDVAGDYARWIALTSFAVFMNKPSVRSMPVLNAQRFHLLYTIILVATRCLALVIGFYFFNSDIVAVGLFGISSLVLNICLFIITLNISNRFAKIER
ncbi:oligosaccharide flippase family protein [Virgibacillus sp. NKC19-3]|uniref:lipopolysaccharide biosynthesis protein n=1 Tax=Virgibacillus saliphilus TaxID=2831674 RepID=UPI001C9B3524|nr:oligosaccharide flippase family protein [Virgibacillus sp. NKC19-3]MBY7144600.1 oligosaccharide flippase family protein [Virgibacillus sp. NKC19-3]